MAVDDIIQLVGLFALIVLPSMAITIRVAMSPMVDAILRLREGLQPDPSRHLADSQKAELAQLRDEVLHLRDSVARLQEADTFYRALQQPSTGSDEATVPAVPQRNG